MSHFGLIGKNLSHSLSASYFSKKFETLGLSSFQYKLYNISHISEIIDLIKSDKKLKGLNITIPYKTDVLPYLDSIDDEAKEIGAVNTLKILRGINSYKIMGFNTDCLGFKDSLTTHKNYKNHKTLILGTGGAARAVAYALKKLNIPYLFVSRNKTTPHSITYHELNEKYIRQYTLIINTTPLGMHPDIDTKPDIPYQFIGKKHFLFDLVYNPPITPFLRKGLEQNAYICNGLNMLYAQAEYSWKIWLNETT